jgi:tetratricopeptide (TPR) repeat protein
MLKRASGVLATVVFILATWSPASAEAAPTGTCHDPAADPEQRVSDCTSLIDSGSLSGVDLSSAYASRAAAYEADEDLASAIQDYDEAASRDPSSVRALNGACRVRAMANTDLRNAAILCERARTSPRALSYRPDSKIDGAELLLLRAGEQVHALQEYDRLLSKGPRKASTLFMRGIVKRQLGDHVGADEDFASASALDAATPRLFKAFGVEDARTGNPFWQQKIAVARKLSALASGFNFSSQLLPESMLESEDYTPEVCLQSEFLDHALRECRRIIKSGEVTGVPLAALEARCAEIEFLQGRHAEAVDDLELATRHDPWNRGYQSNLKIVTTLAAK